MSKENKNINTWDFVEKYYPGYSHTDDIALADDLEKIMNGELNGRALEMFNEQIIANVFELEEGQYPTDYLWLNYKGVMKKFQNDYNRVHLEIYQEAIKAFLEQEKQKEETEASIVWTVKDFESKAESIFIDLKEDEDESVLGMKSWEELFDKTKFKETLKGMIENHDSEYGVNWFTIQCWLESDCKFKK